MATVIDFNRSNPDPVFLIAYKGQLDITPILRLIADDFSVQMLARELEVLREDYTDRLIDDVDHYDGWPLESKEIANLRYTLKRLIETFKEVADSETLVEDKKAK